MQKIKPTKKQLEFLDWEFGVFFHFGIRSFYHGHSDWDGKPMPASGFNPETLDCKNWIRTIREAGAKYAILTCKHHDGFANWPSKYSDYSVAQTPWQDGKGDVVKEFTDACRLYGIKVGLYYSPAQWGGSVKFADGKEYDDYFINQISELLTNYGKIDYLWFDGCGSDGHEYDKKRIINAIRTLQPEIMLFGMWDPDTMWVGNEDGYCTIDNSLEQEFEGGMRFLPAECDCKMRTTTWFNCEKDEDTIKTVDELMGMYEASVGRSANFLINIGPDRRGLLPEKDAQRLLAFGKKLRERYGNENRRFGEVQKTAADEWTIRLPEFSLAPKNRAAVMQLVNRLVIEEDITDGEGVKAFEVYAGLPDNRDKKICIYKGGYIGHKRIIPLPTFRTGEIVVKITKKNGKALLKSIRAYYEE